MRAASMRRSGSWACALAVGLALTALAQADDGDAKPAKTGNWLTRIFTGNDSAKKKDTAKKDEVTPPSAAAIRQQAYWEWQRRLEVCDKLKQIAFDTGDKELDRKADDLDQRAWDIYVQRTGGKDAHHHDESATAPRTSAATASTNTDSRPTPRKD